VAGGFAAAAAGSRDNKTTPKIDKYIMTCIFRPESSNIISGYR
jgi:hypothetical protein